jgi:hypothetical protein
MPGYVSLTNRTTGKEELVDADQVPAAVASGKYLDPGAVAVNRGMARYTTPDVAAREQTVAPVVDPAQAALQQGHDIRERENTGALATAKAVVGGGASGLSFGALNPFEDAQEFNPIASGVGQVAGALAPAFVGDLGGLLGAGREAALADDALTAERAAAGLPSKALYAGETAAGTVEGDLTRAGKAITAGAERPPPVRIPTAAPIGPPLEELDLAGLKTARESELDAIRAAQAPERQGLVNDLAAARKATVEEKPWIATANGKTREVREIGKLTLDADKRIDVLLKNPVELAEKPERVLSALRQQEHALSKLLSWGETEVGDYLEARSAAPETIRAEIMAGKVKGYVPDALSQRGVEAAVERVFAERYGTEMALPTNLKVLNTVPGAVERNKALQSRVVDLIAEPSSDRLQAIDAMLADRAAPHEASFGEKALHAVAPYLGPVGAIAEKAYAGLRRVIGAGAKATAHAANSFIEAAVAAAPKVAPTLGVLSTRALAGVAFAAPAAALAAGSSPPPVAGKKAGAGVGVPAKAADLEALYQQRTAEIRSQTMYGPGGVPVMRPEARQMMAAQLAAIRATSPMLADRIETVGARRMEYLAGIMPHLPDYGVMQLGPDRRRIPDLQMRSFARSVAAVEDPHAALARVAGGNFVPEDANAIRAVYPELLADFTQQIVAKLPTLQKTLPYKRRLALSMLTGVPVDVAMTPAVLREIQGMYAAEPGTAGGTQAPVAQAQFGSVQRTDPGTPAQRREGLTT